MNKIISTMQPYFLPYIGYWQLMSSVDTFVILDNVNFSRGWINRNQLLINNKQLLFTIPLKNCSQNVQINKIKISENYNYFKSKIIKTVSNNFSRESNFCQAMSLFNRVLEFKSNYLFDYLLNSIIEIKKYLKIDTKLVISSELNINDKFKRENLIIEICKKLNANTYYNLLGGNKIYNKKYFSEKKLNLNFHHVNLKLSQQNLHSSIIDLIFKYKKDKVIEMLKYCYFI